jgi:NAD-dependent SIR2 family protein deacetylase
MQQRLLDRNPALADLAAQIAPDGDASLNDFDASEVDLPACASCGGILKPQVVFFGESVPAARVESCFDALAGADAMLVVGSSLMVYSGFRFVRAAYHAEIPIVAINRGKTRADEILSFKIKQDCATALSSVLEKLDTDAGFTAKASCDAVPR